MTAPVFDPPEKGEWISLRDHFPRALTPQYAELLGDAMDVGEAEPMARYGMPVRSLAMRLVHGHVYIAPAPLVGGYRDGVPPRAALWAAARMVPVFRARNRAARAALAARPWREEAARWYATERSEWEATSAALQAEPIDTMAADQLGDHLERALLHARAGYRRHFALHGPDLIPTGLLLSRAADWGLPAHLVLPVLTGSSPASRGESATLQALQEAVAARGPDVVTMEDLRGVAGAELDAFLAEHGWRMVTGYDLDERALVEVPELVLAMARDHTTDGDPDVDRGEAALAVVLAAVPAVHHAELVDLVADARATFGVRDDNGALTAAWPVGLLRRAMLAAGRLLTDGARLLEPDHALEATVAELVGLLGGANRPAPAEVEARAADRAIRSRWAPPPTLGPAADLPLDVLPMPMRTVSRAQLILRDTFTAPPGARPSLSGEGIGTRSHQGRAVVAVDPADALARLEPGDVLVAVGTTPAFNVVLALVGAVVVQEGGLLSHAAVIARELGLPAVIGAADALEHIPDGALVDVDPVAGRVRVLHGGRAATA